MKEYGRVRSAARPEKRVIDEYSVWIHSDIREITTEEGTEYEYDMRQYPKDEYIALMDEKNVVLEVDIEANAQAIEELAALIGGEAE